MSGDGTTGRQGRAGIWCTEVRAAALSYTVHCTGQPPQNKEFSDLNVNDAGVKKP